jgi:hypothetical protein
MKGGRRDGCEQHCIIANADGVRYPRSVEQSTKAENIRFDLFFVSWWSRGKWEEGVWAGGKMWENISKVWDLGFDMSEGKWIECIETWGQITHNKLARLLRIPLVAWLKRNIAAVFIVHNFSRHPCHVDISERKKTI